MFAVALLCAIFSDSQVTDETPDCLNLDPPEEEFDLTKHRECFRDELGFSQATVVHDAEKLLSLDPNEIRFVGCNTAPFRTRIDRTEPELHFEILYNSRFEQSGSVVAILHEIGHVYQLKKVGSREALLTSLHSNLERAELGADYLAGLATGRLHIDENDVDVDLALVGSYLIKSKPHGLPHERSMAFNYGVTDAKGDQSVAFLYGDFQDNSYGQIKQRR